MSRLSEHTITFGGLNSYRDLHLISKKIPIVAFPEPKLDLREVNGMSGKLDYTNVLDENLYYKQRTGSWDFIYFGDSYMNVWLTAYKALHGKVFDIELEDDPDYLYHGRLEVQPPSSNGIKMEVSIKYTLDPKRSLNPKSPLIHEYGLDKYSSDGQFATPSAKDFDWKWDDLFDNTIYYGRFTVEGQKWRNILVVGSSIVIPTITVTADMVLRLASTNATVNLTKGKNIDRTAQLFPGDNIMLFEGNGDVVIDYPIGESL